MMAVDLHSTDPSLLFSPNTSFSLNKLIYTTNSTTTTWSSSDSGSVLGSPVESELGFTETEEESDPEEDYCAELSRQMAHYMLQEDDKHEKVLDLLIKFVSFFSSYYYHFMVLIFLSCMY